MLPPLRAAAGQQERKFGSDFQNAFQRFGFCRADNQTHVAVQIRGFHLSCDFLIELAFACIYLLY
jgi:hypothetical protein